MTFAAIPTKYNGVQFRSRLEARWAAFFDLLKIEWHYEPVDLDGYIPDFILPGNRFVDQTIVEVKPLWIKDDIGDVVKKAFDAGIESIARGFAVVGLGLREHAKCFTDGGDLTIGKAAGRHDGDTWICPFDLLWDSDEWNLVLGDKDSGGIPAPYAVGTAKRLWREAGNSVQWRGVGARR